MIETPAQVEMFYLDDMEDEIIITELKLRRENLDLNVKFFLADTDVTSTLAKRLDKGLALPEIIITDLNMPGKGGLGLINTLRSDDRYKDISIGVCTGSENPADEIAARNGGANFVVVKPFGRAGLIQACEETGRFQLIEGKNGKDRLYLNVPLSIGREQAMGNRCA